MIRKEEMDIERKSFSYYLRKRREELGLSQAALAAKTGIQREYISRLENGKLSNPSYRLQAKLAREGLNISMSDFYRDDQIRPVVPTLSVLFARDMSDSRVKEEMVKRHHFVIPLVRNINALMSGIVHEEDFEAFTVAGPLVRANATTKKPNLVVAEQRRDQTGHFWAVVDLADREVREGKKFLFCEDGQLVCRDVDKISQGLLLKLDEACSPRLPAEREYILFKQNLASHVSVIGRIIVLIKSV